MLFNRGDYWAAHEALEPAWQRAEGLDREMLQGLIQTAAAYHKVVVQGNGRGAATLMGWAEERLRPVPQGAWGLDLDPFREALAEWHARLAAELTAEFRGTLYGLPRLEWSRQGERERLHVERVDLYLLDFGLSRSALVRLEADGAAGWGECRLAWDVPGAWLSLVSVLAPALLAEPVAAPSEVGVLWSGLLADPRPAAGLEAALWDLWARRHGWSLTDALDIDRRPIEVIGRAEGMTQALLRTEAERLIGVGYRHVLLPARPNADRRILPGLVSQVDATVILDLGAAYRIADLDALRVLDESGAAYLHRPFGLQYRHSYQRLCRYLATPVSAGAWPDADEAQDALMSIAADGIAVDPGLSGITEAIRILEVAAARGKPAWVTSTATTAVGLAVDAAVAMHAQCLWPADLSSACGEAGLPLAQPSTDGTWMPRWDDETLGNGVTPDSEWLHRVAVQHAHLGA